jgi:hypothetical protein
MSANKIMAIGHLGANPVVRTLRSGSKVVPSGIGSLLLGSLADISERFLSKDARYTSKPSLLPGSTKPRTVPAARLRASVV